MNHKRFIWLIGPTKLQGTADYFKQIHMSAAVISFKCFQPSRLVLKQITMDHKHSGANRNPNVAANF